MLNQYDKLWCLSVTQLLKTNNMIKVEEGKV